MDMHHPYWTQRRTRTTRSILSMWLILTMLLGGVLGPAIFSPAASQAAPPAQVLQITLTKSEQSDFSPDGFASYGEIITYILQYTVPAGETATGATLDDVFSNPPAPEVFLPIDYLNGTHTGPDVISGGCTDPPDVTPTPDETDPGRPAIHWDLGNISNSTGGACTFEITYQALVFLASPEGAYDRTAHSTATIDWNEGGPQSDTEDVVLIQPATFSFNMVQDPPSNPNTELGPGDPVTWTLTFLNQDGNHEGTAYDLWITDTMPLGTRFDGAFGDVPPFDQVGRRVRWYVNSIPVLGDVDVGINASLPLSNNVAHARLFNESTSAHTSCPGDCVGERSYYGSRNTTAYIKNVEIGKAQISRVLDANNDEHKAVAGEFVTITVVFTVPQGIIIYNSTMRILLEDGLAFVEPIQPPIVPDPEINPPDQDPWKPGGTWTQLEWAWDTPGGPGTITDTAGGPVVVTYTIKAQVRQEFFLPNHPGEPSHGSLLRIVPILRWSADPATPPDDYDEDLRQRNDINNATVSVQFIRPDLRYQSDTSGSRIDHTFEAGEFEGGANVIFTLHLKNRTTNPPHPTAHEIVLTDTLSPNLGYLDASPPPDLVEPDPVLGTLLHWTLPTPILNNEEIFVITATMPPTMVAGAAVTCTAQASYETLAVDRINEGRYLDDPYTAQDIVVGGFDLYKEVVPNDNVKIGDSVDFTVTLVLNPGMVMYTPFYEDILPLGFHYVPGSMVVEPNLLAGNPTYTPTTGARQLLSWDLLTVDNAAGAGSMTVTMRYQATMTGEDTDGFPVFASNRNHFVAKQLSRNEVSACWHATEQGGGTFCLAGPIQATTYVVQPYLADIFVKSRPQYPTEEYEVGETVQFQVELNNTGQGPAYEIVVVDTLPQGIAITDSWLEPEDPPGNLIGAPPVGATGVVSWTLGQLAAGDTVVLHYDTMVLANVIPGDWLTNTAEIENYTSQPGSGNPYDRQYGEIGPFTGDPIPDKTSGEPFIVLGLSLHKTDNPDPVAPGAVLNYRLEFGNSSLLYGATNVRITDTYDANLTYLTAVFLPPINGCGHDRPNRTLCWYVDNIGPGGELDDYYIDITFVVTAPLSQDEDILINYAAIDGDGDMTGMVERLEETTIEMPYMTTAKSATPAFVAPGQRITYTLNYGNIGPIDATNVVIEELYDNNVTYVSANPPPDVPPNLWNIGTLTPTAWGEIEVVVEVDQPAPPGVDFIYNRFRISCDEVYPVTSPFATTTLLLPILNVNITDFPDPVNEGGQILYTINYANYGNIDATDVLLTNTFDPYTTFQTSSVPPTGCSGNDCWWDLGNVAAQDSGSFTVQVVVDETVPSNICYLVDRISIESNEVGAAMFTEQTALNRPCLVFIFLPLVTKGY